MKSIAKPVWLDSFASRLRERSLLGPGIEIAEQVWPEASEMDPIEAADAWAETSGYTPLADGPA